MVMPYEGIRIIDFTQLEQGPVGTQILSDFGAEVIKVERLGTGEIGRAQYPQVNGVSCYFMVNNRNKKSIAVDVSRPEGKEIILRLVKTADVVASNFRPGVMERLGFGYEDLRKVNPRIICAYASGYGRTGPYRDKRGQDLIGQAMGGLMAMTGESGGPPTAAGTWVIDYIGAMHFAQGIMIALAARERTGEGQETDTCLLNAGVAVHLQEGTGFLNTGQLYPRPLRGIGHAHSGPLYAAYQTKDGKWLAIVASFVDQPWKRVCAALGIDDDSAEAPRFQTRAGQVEHQAELRDILERAFAQKDRDEALRLLEERDILCGPIYEYPEVFADPQVIHNEMVAEIEHPLAGTTWLVGIPVKLSKTPGSVRTAAPTVGQHTAEVLSQLGYSASEIQALREKGVVET